MAAKLRVYVSNLDGVHEWIVAAANQAEALKAWGVGQNLFAQGAAKVTKAPDALKAALAAPGRPLRRLAGGASAFVEAAPGGDAAGWRAAATAAGVTSGKMKSTTKPRRGRASLKAAEAALGEFRTRAAKRRAEIDRRRRALEDESRNLEGALALENRRLEASMKKARRAAEA